VGRKLRKFAAQSGVPIAIGANEHAAPGFLAGAKAKHELPAEVRGLGAEHRAEHKCRLRRERLPQPGKAVDGAKAV
jgi:hypothetical protein